VPREPIARKALCNTGLSTPSTSTALTSLETMPHVAEPSADDDVPITMAPIRDSTQRMLVETPPPIAPRYKSRSPSEPADPT
jgi:hypothetical protein